MQILEYPFDSAYILKNKRSIKKELLSEGSFALTKKIAVLGGSTTSEIVKILELFLLNYGIKPQFYESEYNRYWQDACFENKELEEFAPDIIFIHTSNRNLIKKDFSPNCTKEQIDAELSEQLEHFTQMWENIARVYKCPIIQNNFELPYYRLLGNADCSNIGGKTRYINELNRRFADFAENHSSFYINDIAYLSASFGLEKWSDPYYWHMFKYALSVPAIPEFAFNVANIIKSIFGMNKKVLALDLDNTLWGGIVGDDGVSGIEIGQETPMSQVYSEFQSYIKSHKDLGIMLTVCSKNEHENAVAGLKHPQSVLSPDDFVVIKANWEPKDKNLVDTAEELNILPESIVFVDDNPAERAIARGQIAKMAIPEIEKVENYIKTIDRNGYFEVTSYSADDAKRVEMYKANAQRTQAQKRFENYEDYLLSLEMKAEILPFCELYLARITQLTNKSNQFNVTTKRYTIEQMNSVCADSSYVTLYGKLIDKFGDNGVVSVVIGNIKENALHIDLWLMSCRVLKRDMEYAMLDTLVSECRKRSISMIYGYYYPTAKNAMVRNLFGDFGFEQNSVDEQGNSVWSLDITGYENKNKVIKVN